MTEIQPAEGQANGGGGLVVNSLEPVGPKRQRRPSVRLGDIGDQQYESYVRRSNRPWKMGHDGRKDSNFPGKASKTRPLVNLSSSGGGGGGDGEFTETLNGEDKEGNLDSVAIGSWKVKETKKRGLATTKRVRSNWVSRIDGGGAGNGVGVEGDEKYSAGEYIDEGYRDFEVENSESPVKDHSPVHSLENMAVDGAGSEREMHYHGNRRTMRARISESRDRHDGVDISGPSDTDGRDWKCGTSGERNGTDGKGRCGEDSVRIWLNGLGLGRYAPVFEIHEVDDEVLPMLTLEDLKDMGINAVGSRRKMYSAIQKLGKGFS